MKLRCVELKISSNPPTENIARIANAVHLFSVTINCLVTKIVMNPGSQLSVLKSVSQIAQLPMIAPLGCSLMEVDRKVGM